jgi:transposase
MPLANRVVEFKIDLSQREQAIVDGWLNLGNWIWNRGLALLCWHEYWIQRQRFQFLPKISPKDLDVEVDAKILRRWGFCSFDKIVLARLRWNLVGKNGKKNVWGMSSDRTTVKRWSLNELKKVYPGFNQYYVEAYNDCETIYSGHPDLIPGSFIRQFEGKKGTTFHLHVPGIEPVKQHWVSEPPFDYSGKGDPYNSLSRLFSNEALKADTCVPDDIADRIAEMPSKFRYSVLRRLGKAWGEYKSKKRGKPRFKRSGDTRTLTDANAAKRLKSGLSKDEKRAIKQSWEADRKARLNRGEPDIGKYTEPKSPVVGSTWKIDGNRVKLPSVNWWLRVKGLSRRWGDRPIVNASIVKKPSGYYLQLTGEFESNLKGVTLNRSNGDLQAVGIDAGAVTLFCDDSGRKFLARCDRLNDETLPPRVIRRFQRKSRETKRLRRLQRQLARRKKGSQNWQKTKQAIAKLQEKQARRGRASDHKYTTRLVRQYDGIALEDLNLRGMTAASKTKVTEDGNYAKNRRKQKAGLNRSLLRNSHGRRAEMLQSKARDINKTVGSVVREVVKVNPKNTSIECSKCHYIDPANRPNQATFQCVKCGHTDHADTNASKNILLRATDASGRSSSPFARSYRPWGWEVKPVSGGDAPSGEICISESKTQEAAPSTVLLEGDRNGTKARDMASNLENTFQNQVRDCKLKRVRRLQGIEFSSA